MRMLSITFRFCLPRFIPLVFKGAAGLILQFQPDAACLYKQEHVFPGDAFRIAPAEMNVFLVLIGVVVFNSIDQ